MIRTYTLAATAGAMTLAAFPLLIQKASAQETINVTAQVGNGCTLTVPDISFGVVDPVTGDTANANLVIDCNPGTFQNVSFTGNGGLSGANSGNARTMALDGNAANVSDATKNLDYLLDYTPQGGAPTNWINQDTVAFSLDANGDHTAALTGTMTAQAAPEEGVYSDTITFNVAFNE